jgi:hypothetical protein
MQLNMQAFFLLLLGAGLTAFSLQATIAAERADEPMIQIAADELCPEPVIPVCGTKDGKRKDYNNDCLAKKDGATDITEGKCDGSK